MSFLKCAQAGRPSRLVAQVYHAAPNSRLAARFSMKLKPYQGTLATYTVVGYELRLPAEPGFVRLKNVNFQNDTFNLLVSVITATLPKNKFDEKFSVANPLRFLLAIAAFERQTNETKKANISIGFSFCLTIPLTSTN